MPTQHHPAGTAIERVATCRRGGDRCPIEIHRHTIPIAHYRYVCPGIVSNRNRRNDAPIPRAKVDLVAPLIKREIPPRLTCVSRRDEPIPILAAVPANPK